MTTSFFSRLKRKVPSLLSPLAHGHVFAEFDSISSHVKVTLSDDAKTEICQRLAQGVYYIYGMGVQGDVAEFGTMTGKTATALSTALDECGRILAGSDQAHGFCESRHLYLFDSFEGLPPAQYDEETLSPHVASGVWGKGTCKGLTPQGLFDICSRYINPSRLHIVEGWFRDTVASSINSPLALIHVDGDLYESAMDALNPLFQKKLVSKGAILFFDDWNCNRADPGHGEKKAWADLVSRYSIAYSDEGPYGIVGHRFIIQSYSA